MTIFKIVIIAIFCACMFGAGYYCGAEEKDSLLYDPDDLLYDGEPEEWEDEDV